MGAASFPVGGRDQVVVYLSIGHVLDVLRLEIADFLKVELPHV
jgi:hypothetical protein